MIDKLSASWRYFAHYRLKNFFIARLVMRENEERNLFKRLGFNIRLYLKVFRNDVIPSFDLSVGTICTLKCKDCSQWCPYLNDKRWFDINTLKSNMEEMVNKLDYIFSVAVIGGEPLAYPNIVEIVDFLIGNNKIGNVILVTNGTLYPSDELIKRLKSPKVTLWVSEYVTLPMTDNRTKLYNLLEDKSIKSRIMHNMTWADVGRPSGIRENYTERQLNNSFKTCWLNNCSTLMDGIFYRCPRSYGIDNIYGDDSYSRPETIDFKDIKNKRELKNAIYKFYSLKYVEACKYCNIVRKDIPAAEQLD